MNVNRFRDNERSIINILYAPIALIFINQRKAFLRWLEPIVFRVMSVLCFDNVKCVRMPRLITLVGVGKMHHLTVQKNASSFRYWNWTKSAQRIRRCRRVVHKQFLWIRITVSCVTTMYATLVRLRRDPKTSIL